MFSNHQSFCTDIERALLLPSRRLLASSRCALRKTFGGRTSEPEVYLVSRRSTEGPTNERLINLKIRLRLRVVILELDKERFRRFKYACYMVQWMETKVLLNKMKRNRKQYRRLQVLWLMSTSQKKLREGCINQQFPTGVGYLREVRKIFLVVWEWSGTGFYKWMNSMICTLNTHSFIQGEEIESKSTKRIALYW